MSIIILSKLNSMFKLDSIFNKLVISFILITVFLSIALTCFFTSDLKKHYYLWLKTI
ncbi:hypothetical protein JOC47_000324 [Halanaerobacter jeridensis]|uniref:Uncharacterized protein n=1 Tax=Halanaerobacter jeridensis TaxID=706427 RepID=A0A939BM28_9FIRM|nr:hypothetical protein [Halanaerobacter jeridensis]